MITIFTQNCGLINVSDFKHILYAQDSETQENMIVLDDKYVLGKYKLEEIPNIIAWIGSSIAQHKIDENLCISMPMSTNTQEDNEECKE